VDDVVRTEPSLLRWHCEASLHWPITDRSVEDAFDTLMSLRSIGISNFGVRQMEEALATGARIDVNQLCYNLLSRAIEFEILPMGHLATAWAVRMKEKGL